VYIRERERERITYLNSVQYNNIIVFGKDNNGSPLSILLLLKTNLTAT
jgi:hypothetical protein